MTDNVSSTVTSIKNSIASLATGTVTAATKGLNAAAQFALTPNNTYYSMNNLTQFPFDLPVIPTPTGDQTFCMMFQFYQYERQSILVAPSLSPIGAVALPIPSNLLDSSQQNYEASGSKSVAVGAALDHLGSTQNIAGAIQSMGSSLLGIGEGAAATGAGVALDKAEKFIKVQNINRGLSLAGIVQNPFLSVLYNAPAFKRHQFEWTFIPESSKDSDVLKYISNKFRFHSFPGVNPSLGGILLNYPDLVTPVIIPSGHVYSFKPCVITEFAYDYAPGSNPSFTKLAAPSAMRVSLTLLEIEFWTKGDLSNSTSGLPASPFASIFPYQN